MDYSKYVFKNKPALKDILKNNIFISGECGSGKSILLHQIVEEIVGSKKFNKSTLVIDDPRKTEFSSYKTQKFSNRVIYSPTNEDFRNFIETKIEDRKKTTKKNYDDELIIVVSDEIYESELFDVIMDHYLCSVSFGIVFITCSQLRDVYYKNKECFDSGVVYQLIGQYGDKNRSIEITTKDISQN